MDSIVVNLKIAGSKAVANIKALVDTGFFGDVMTRSKIASDLGIELPFERTRALPSGQRVRVRFGITYVELLESLAGVGLEVWDELKLPEGVEALLGVTALEKLGFRVNPKEGGLRKWSCI